MKICKRKGADTATGITRLDLRASKSKIKQLANKCCLPSPAENLNAFIACSPKITRKEIPDIISRMVEKGTFHTYSYVMGQIYHSGYKQNTKYDMMLIVDYFPVIRTAKICLINWNSQDRIGMNF